MWEGVDRRRNVYKSKEEPFAQAHWVSERTWVGGANGENETSSTPRSQTLSGYKHQTRAPTVTRVQPYLGPPASVLQFFCRACIKLSTWDLECYSTTKPNKTQRCLSHALFLR